MHFLHTFLTLRGWRCMSSDSTVTTHIMELTHYVIYLWWSSDCHTSHSLPC